MALFGFEHKSGDYELGMALTEASSALVPGDSCVNLSGTLDIGTTGNKIVGVSLGTKLVGDSATTAVQFLKILSGNIKFYANVVSGTYATTDVLGFKDLAGASGAQGIADNSNSDLYLDTVLVAGSSGTGIVIFADPGYRNATN